jgi:FkbM family methyltransferase
MAHTKRPTPFVLVSSSHGTLIINSKDVRMTSENSGFGIGFQILTTGGANQEEIELANFLIQKRHQYFGNGVIVLDCGANIGVHTVEWAKTMHGWGHIYAFEAQEKIFYALAGNLIINNCFNATAKHCALGAQCGTLDIPEPNYCLAGSFGSLELKPHQKNEFIGQKIDYEKTKPIPLISIDSLNLLRSDFLKIDVEGMEEDVLIGAEKTIQKHKPIMLIEHIKSDLNKMTQWLKNWNYKFHVIGINVLAIHETDPIHQHLTIEGNYIKVKN